MKKRLLSLVGFALVLSSCLREPEIEPGDWIPLIIPSAKTHSAEQNADALRHWYLSKASPQERHDFWFQKIQLDLNYFEFDLEQREFVLEIFDQLDPSDFKPYAKPTRSFTNWVEAWLERAEQYGISRAQMGQFVFSLTPASLGPSLGLTFIDQCNCSTESDWCDFLNEGPSSECIAFCEEESSRGCGTMLLYDCDKDRSI